MSMDIMTIILSRLSYMRHCPRGNSALVAISPAVLPPMIGLKTEVPSAKGKVGRGMSI